MKKIFFYISLFYTINNTFAQKISSVEHFTINNGLSQNTITYIYQSKNGLIWFGSQDGVNIYNGYEFEILKQEPTNENSLSNGHINCITEDINNNMVFATQNGLNIWNPSTNNFKRLFYNPQSDKSYTSNILQVIRVDSFLWCITSKSLIKIDSKYNYKIFSNKIVLNPYFYSYITPEIVYDDNKNLWISSENGVIIFNIENETFYRIFGEAENITSKNVRTILIDNKKNIWIGTSKGINQFLPTNHFKQFFYKNSPHSYKDNYITKLFIDTSNTFWVGTQSGIKTFNGISIEDFQNNELQKIKSTITSIYQDNSSNIWISTVGDGIYKININKPKFDSYTNYPDFINKLIFSIFVDDKYIFTGSNYLSIFDKNTQKPIEYITINEQSDENIIINIKKIDNKLWLLTNNFIIIYNIENKQITNFFDYFKIKTDYKISKFRVYDAIKDSDTYWIATYNGLLKLDKYKKITLYNTNNSELSSNVILRLLKIKDKLWLATMNGLNIIDIKTDKVYKLSVKDGLPNNNISNIEKYNDSINIITTLSGFALINSQTLKIQKVYSKKTQNFINDFFYCSIVDKNKNIWLSSNYGIVKYNLKENSFTTYISKDGLPSLEFNTNAYFLDNDTIYFGCTNGITWTNINTPKVENTEFEVFINKIVYSDYNNKIIKILYTNEQQLYKFSYKSFLKIYFYLSPSNSPELNKFKYRIIGYSNQWSEIQTENFINLVGLEPGQYTLQIMGQNDNGLWSNKTASLRFTIIPPFNKSNVAKIFLVSILILIFVFIFFIYYRKIKKENQILTEKNIAFSQIEKQKFLLEEQAKNISDSLHYAQHIIAAMLSPIEQLNLIIPENFIFLQPKEIVSGDFYWFAEKNNKTYIAAVDCTGHGIPGAFMSIIGMNLLNRLVNNGHTDPGVILNLMNKEIIETFKKNLNEEHIKDGMDIALCVIDINNKNLQFAGAYNPAYIIRDDNLIQLKGDRKSIGNDFEFDAYTTLSFKLYNDDVIYIFSDGYADQFGGPERRKFKQTKFRYLLLTIYKLPFFQQREVIKNTFLEWKKDYEQVDDILIIGFKPLSKLNT